MKKKMFLLDVCENKNRMVEVESLEDYYAAIGCDCIEIVQRTIGGEKFTIICDDEGMFVDKPKISAINPAGKVMFVGNLLIAGGKIIDGELTSISPKGVDHVVKNIIIVNTEEYPKPYCVLANVDVTGW